jgi:DNA-binding XRE family transcriptional regulator
MAGRPAHKPTEQNIKTVRAMVAYGITHNEIAAVLGIDKKTLYKYYREEIDKSKPLAVAKIAEKLYAEALAGNMTAMIFYLKTQAGWRERQEIEHIGEMAVVNIDWSASDGGKP